MRHIVEKVDKYYPMICVFIFYLFIGFFIFRNLLSPGIWNFGDTQFAANEQGLSNYFEEVFYTWWDHEFLGAETIPNGCPRMSYIMILYFGFLITKNLAITQFIWWIFIFVASGISMYLLTYNISKNYTAAFIASMFYALNPFMVIRFSHVLIMQAYPFIPFLFLFYKRLLETNEIKYAFLCSFALFFIIPSPHYSFLAIALLIFYLIYALLIQHDQSKRKKYIYNSLKATIISIMLLGFYSFPLQFSLTNKNGTLISALHNMAIAKSGMYWGAKCTILEAMRTLGYQDSVYSPDIQGPFVFKTIWIFSTFVIPMLYLYYFVHDSREKYTKTSRSIMMLFGLFLISSIFLSSSATLFNGLVYDYIGFLPMLSSDPTYFNFAIVFSCSPLFGMGGNSILQKINAINSKKHFKRYYFLLIIIILIIGIISYPILLWDMDQYKKVQYPASYDNLRDYLGQMNESVRIYLPVPFNGPGVANFFRWAPYEMSNWISYVLPASNYGYYTLEVTPVRSISISSHIREYLLNGNPNLEKILGIMGTKYIILNMDFEGGQDVIRVYADKLKIQPGIWLDKVYSGIRIYRVNDKNFIPHISLATTPILVDDVSGMFKIITSDDCPIGQTVFFKSDDLKKSQLNLIRDKLINFTSLENIHYSTNYFKDTTNNYEPLSQNSNKLRHATMVFQKINPTKYKVHLTCSGPIFLILSESYNPQWKAYLDKPFGFNTIVAEYDKLNVSEARSVTRFTPEDVFYLFAKPLPENNHFIANTYANAWYINNAGDYDITLYYLPQSAFYLGLIISIITLCLGIIYIRFLAI